MIVSPEQYDRMLEALEDAEDAASFDEAEYYAKKSG